MEKNSIFKKKKINVRITRNFTSNFGRSLPNDSEKFELFLCVTLGLFTVTNNLSFSPPGCCQQRRLEDHQRPQLQCQRQPERDEGDLLRLQQSLQQCHPGDETRYNSQ